MALYDTLKHNDKERIITCTLLKFNIPAEIHIFVKGTADFLTYVIEKCFALAHVKLVT